MFQTKAVEKIKTHCVFSNFIKINGMRIEMLMFADDTAIMAQVEINLKRALEIINDVLKVTTK
jgi:hypothetical protein